MRLLTSPEQKQDLLQFIEDCQDGNVQECKKFAKYSVNFQLRVGEGKNRLDMSPLDVVSQQSSPEHLEILQLLIDRGARINDKTLLHCIDANASQAAKILIKSFPNTIIPTEVDVRSIDYTRYIVRDLKKNEEFKESVSQSILDELVEKLPLEDQLLALEAIYSELLSLEYRQMPKARSVKARENAQRVTKLAKEWSGGIEARILQAARSYGSDLPKSSAHEAILRNFCVVDFDTDPRKKELLEDVFDPSILRQVLKKELHFFMRKPDAFFKNLSTFLKNDELEPVVLLQVFVNVLNNKYFDDVQSFIDQNLLRVSEMNEQTVTGFSKQIAASDYKFAFEASVAVLSKYYTGDSSPLTMEDIYVHQEKQQSRRL